MLKPLNIIDVRKRGAKTLGRIALTGCLKKPLFANFLRRLAKYCLFGHLLLIRKSGPSTVFFDNTKYYPKPA